MTALAARREGPAGPFTLRRECVRRFREIA